jgi:anti-anti-sigma regulatory factor
MQVREQSDIAIITLLSDECGGLAKIIDPLLERGRNRFVFDMSQATFLNSLNIAAIISTRNRIITAGGKAAIANLGDNIKSVFRILKLERMFDLDLDLAAALAQVR